MKCMKCGREMETEQVFCDDCLLEMEKYPVNPGTAVHLPLRKDIPVSRKSPSRRRTVSPEEQIQRLKKRVWFLSGTLVVTLMLLLAMIYPTVNFFLRNYHLRPGQNYTTITPSTTVPSTTAATEIAETTETYDPFEGMAE